VIKSKVMVVGPSEAGKSTLIRLLSDRAVNLEYRGRTVAMDHAVLRRDGTAVSIVGVPGQPRFAPVREALSQRAAGAIWVHPAAQAPDPSTIDLLKQWVEPLPYLVVVNQREGGSPDTAFHTPSGLPSPREIITGNLVVEADLGRRIETAIWGLARE